MHNTFSVAVEIIDKEYFMKRIAIISSHPAPYRDAFLTEIVRQYPLGVDVYSLFSYDKGHSYWNLKDAQYSPINLKAEEKSSLRMIAILVMLFVVYRKYDFVLWPCWAYRCLKLPIFISALFGKNYGLCADSIEQKAINWLLLKVKQFVIKRAKVVFVPGKAGVDFFIRQFSVSPQSIVMGSYSLDGNNLEKEILNRRQILRDNIRDRLDVKKNDSLYLMVANMIPTRHYPIMVSGFLNFAKNRDDVKLVIVGNGSDYDKMIELSKVHNKLKVLPGCSFDDMLSLYAASDVYVHSGKEPASTALVLGGIAHLPLISSMAVGCSADVLVDGVSGFKVENFMDSLSWERGFERSKAFQSRWRQMGLAARDLSRKLDVEPTVAHFISKMSNL